MATMVKSLAIQGIDGYRVDIEVTTLEGQPMLSIIGLGDLAFVEWLADDFIPEWHGNGIS